ncbi:SMP-30/gluconolactonase/LRE family protein [Falsiroseomonas sp. HW251]|uniref:SMP-30/gluconolactonase/LRE family protein n=1 Tax=Falsiroseomonas sp. HW251 TaxID=3390998 RepID=UPI003D31F3F2
MRARQQANDEDAGVPGTQALTRGIALLNLVADAPAPLRFVDIAERAGLARPTAHRILAALVEARLLRHDAATQTFALGARFLEMAHRVWEGFDLRATAAPELERLARLAGETARLAVLDGDGVLYVDQRDAEQEAVRLVNRVGARVAPHASACGKAMLAQLPAAERRVLLSRATLPAGPRAIADADALERDLLISAARGYALSLEEAAAGVNAVAAAVLDRRARPLGAICLVGPAFRLNEAKLHALGREVMEAARRISGNAAQSAMTLQVAPRPDSVSPGVEVAVRAEALLGEGPLWSARDNRLLWVDILAPAIHLSDPATGEDRVVATEEMVAALAPREAGGFVAAARSGLRAFDGASLGKVLAAPIADTAALRLNDGKCDAAGRFWVGSLALDSTPDAGALHRLDAQGAQLMQAGLHVPNGLGFSRDNRLLYLADSARRRVDVFDFDLASGSIANRRVFASFGEDEGVPDGLAVDEEGGVWIALWDGWRVVRHAPDGRLDRVIHLPVPRPTSCCFGGADLGTLYVTSARVRLSAAQLAEAPLSGSVFALDPGGVRGLPDHAFLG